MKRIIEFFNKNEVLALALSAILWVPIMFISVGAGLAIFLAIFLKMINWAIK